MQKIQSTQRCIQRSRKIYRKHQNRFLQDLDAQDAAVLNLIRSCELAIDMANYIIKRDKQALYPYDITGLSGLVSVHGKACLAGNSVHCQKTQRSP
ncbi:MAG: DUF86 domain-containing protein [Nitrosomonas sp.]|nr:DUF86 domain-containing protein [Nitrosomonas sp.]